MTKKDYEAIARVIKSEIYTDANNNEDFLLQQGGNAALHAVTLNLADVFQSDNPRFDRVKFLKACGVE